MRQAEPPPAVRAAVVRLADAMSLDYGAFDFLMSNGRPTFLEVSPTGDWRWIETRIGTAPVTMAVARMLRDLCLESAPVRRAGASPIELTTFLSGGVRDLPESY